jgi:hypothetical protein
VTIYKLPLKKQTSKSNRVKSRSKKKATLPNGDDLLNQVIKLTGIPAALIKRELRTILDRKNMDPKDLTLDELRSVVASYMREIMGSLLDRATHSKKSDPSH